MLAQEMITFTQLTLMPMILLAIVILVPLIWVIATYNLLVKLRLHCRESWSGIDTELKRRYDLIPNLVETVRGYAAHEADTLARVTQARNAALSSSGSVASQARDENILVDSLKQLFAVSERYPNLKAADNFLRLQRELANTEDRIQAARRFYNGNVRDYNTRTHTFPSNILASLFRFADEDFFEIDNVAIRETPDVRFNR